MTSFNHLTSWRSKLCNKLVNWVILNKTFIKLLKKNNKSKENRVVILIWLLLLNNLFLPCTEVNGSSKLIFQLNMQVFLLVSENRPVHMGKTIGVFSESISLKKSNNSLLQNHKTLGKFINKWSEYLNNIIKHWIYHIE